MSLRCSSVPKCETDDNDGEEEEEEETTRRRRGLSFEDRNERAETGELRTQSMFISLLVF